ncbi:translation elongation factor Ts [Buchnera aphidicola (Mindarus keteleerifoliae)]|uniref:translation elongation factor Ts n=1 Tax=Buchnera aphidicola TaxID=9 RepID=UPI0031B6DDA2
MNKKIKASLVKKLRDRTGAGIIECRNALIKTNENLENAIDFLKTIGEIKAEKRSSYKTKQGKIFLKVKNKKAAILELNCETDFVAKEKNFTFLGREIVEKILFLETNDFNRIKLLFEKEKKEIISKLGENINIRRLKFLMGNNIISYIHHCEKIGVLLVIDSKNDLFSKNLAMHIAASKPRYLNSNIIPEKIINREKNIILNSLKNSNKSDKIIEKIIKGKIKKFKDEISLTGQNFILEPKKNVSQLLKQHDSHIISFERFEVGEICFD